MGKRECRHLKTDLLIPMASMRTAIGMHHTIVGPDQLRTGDPHGVGAEQLVVCGDGINAPKQLELGIHETDVHIGTVVTKKKQDELVICRVWITDNCKESGGKVS